VFAYIQVFGKKITYLAVSHGGDMCMQNNNPKSENPAMKERAARDKDEKGRLQNDDRHRAPTHPERGGKHNVAPEPSGKPKSENLTGG
jgi:hypothetical protein